MIRELRPALAMFILFTALTGVAYPLAMTEAAQAFRDLSLALTFVPVFGSVGGAGARSLLAEDNVANLVRIGEPAFSFQVGNPFGITTTVALRVRRIDLPPDWLVTLSADAVTLAPGQQVTVTATATPGLPGIQGTLPRFAVEGYANGELLGGVELLAEVARVGLVALYFRAPDGRVGFAIREGDGWTWQTVDGRADADRIEGLFETLGKGIRTGAFDLPWAFGAIR